MQSSLTPSSHQHLTSLTFKWVIDLRRWLLREELRMGNPQHPPNIYILFVSVHSTHGIHIVLTYCAAWSVRAPYPSSQIRSRALGLYVPAAHTTTAHCSGALAALPRPGLRPATGEVPTHINYHIPDENLKKGLPWGKRAPVASLPGAHGELDR
jgi:hypothetical protein